MHPLSFANPGFSDFRMLFESAPVWAQVSATVIVVAGFLAVGGFFALAGLSSLAARRVAVAGGAQLDANEKDVRDVTAIGGVVGALVFLLGVAFAVKSIAELF